ncbi:MAG: molybdopterin molybdotransferase MoeA [Anaerolineae bacterium]|nr:molybdopterin molybdotransferase MoeA [Anaerolineae bacterium]
MPEFFNVLPPDEARAHWLEHVTHRTEAIPAPGVLDRVLATRLPVAVESAPSPEDLPAFPRSTVDGYAVRARDTFGASDSLPAYLTVVGEAHMGERPAVTVDAGEAALIHTGAMIPDGADAVVMVENTQQAAEGEIEVLRRAAPGENVLQIGEDVRQGQEVLPAGLRLRPQDIGALLALGLGVGDRALTIRRPPQAAIFSTGDEVIEPVETPAPGQIRDINSATIAALAADAGALPLRRGIMPDHPDALREALRLELMPPGAADLVVVTAGSSVSARDMTAAVIDRLAAEFGGPGVLVHGVAMKPGKPTILAAVNGRPVLGLPGNPVSALVAFWLFGVPAVYHVWGARMPVRPRVSATLTANVPSSAGREDYVPVVLHEDADGLRAEPVFGKSNLIFTLVRADGLLKVPLNATGLRAGEAAEVYFF